MRIDPLWQFMKMLLPILLSMSIISSCNRGETAPQPAIATAKKLVNVPYGSDSAQRMDVYLPGGRSATKTKSLILIHGGGWNAGSKADFASYIDTFQKRMPEFAIFNIEYRLFNGGNLFPTQENDIRAAIDFIIDNASSYGIDTSRLSLLGVSAGGHLALLQAYKHHQPRIQAVVNFFGPTDLTAMYNNPWHPMVTYALQMITGTTPTNNSTIYYNSSPVNFVSAGSPPTLLLHGSNDQVVHVSQSRLLQQKLQRAGVPHDLVVYKGERHGWYGKTLTNSFDRIEAFLSAHAR